VFFRKFYGCDLTIDPKNQDGQKVGEQGTLMATLIEATPVSITVHDFKGNRLYANQKTLDIFGYSREEFLKLNLWDQDALDGQSLVNSRMQELMKRGETSFEVQHIGKDGTKILFLINARKVRWCGEDAILSTATDVTALKREEMALQEAHDKLVATLTAQKVIELQLRETKEKLEYILGITKTGIDIIDEDFNLIYIDPTWQEQYGNPKERKCYDYFMGRSSICPTCGIPQALLSKQITVSEEILVKEHNRIVEVHTIPLQDSTGKWFVAEFNLDITERKRLEDALRENVEKYRHIFERVSDLIIVTDANYCVVSISPSVKTILEYEPDEIVGTTFWNSPAFPPGTNERVQQWVLKLLSGNQGGLDNFAVQSRSGRRVILEVLTTPILKDGKLIALISIARDVTARNAAEEQLRQVEQDRKIFLEKTLQISEIKSNLITQTAHELKTPLTSIIGWADLLYSAKKQGKSLDATFDIEDFESILRNSERLDNLINDSLDVGRIESGRFELLRKRVDFNEILENAMQAVDYLAAQKHIRIIMEMSTSTNISIDRRRMEQVLINLLSNAVKYSPEKTRVTVRTKTIEINARKVFQVLVIDEGYGFTPEELTEATTQFGKAYTRQEQKRAVQGTGLGLFISRRIVEQHDGSLAIRSEGVNKGTQVEILLPLGD
jgi:PAS domain S-box-containing protein